MKIFVSNPEVRPTNAFVETDGYVSIEAEHYTANQGWELIPDYGRTLSAMTTPSTGAATPPNSPSLEYRMYLFTAGKAEVETILAPTLNFVPGRGLRYAIAFDDAQVGRLLAALASRGLDDRTVVAIAADHGESLGEHGELTHGLLLYEPVLSVPLLLRAPGLAARRVDTPVSLVDLAPSLAGLLRQPLPAPPGGALDGRDLSAALLAGREPAASELYAETRYPEVFGWSPRSSRIRYSRATSSAV